MQPSATPCPAIVKTEQRVIQFMNSPETKLIHGNSKVPGLVITAIDIPVIHGYKVNITEDETVIAPIISQGFQEAHIQQLGSIKGIFAKLQKKMKASHSYQYSTVSDTLCIWSLSQVTFHCEQCLEFFRDVQLSLISLENPIHYT